MNKTKGQPDQPNEDLICRVFDALDFIERTVTRCLPEVDKAEAVDLILKLRRKCTTALSE
jgi:hypothetical protein